MMDTDDDLKQQWRKAEEALKKLLDDIEYAIWVAVAVGASVSLGMSLAWMM